MEDREYNQTTRKLREDRSRVGVNVLSVLLVGDTLNAIPQRRQSTPSWQ
jgi:hypothetical protein